MGSLARLRIRAPLVILLPALTSTIPADRLGAEGALPATLVVAAQGTPEGGLPEVDGWSLATSLLAPRSEQAVAELDGMIYVVGGYPPGRIPSDVVQVYEVASRGWSYAPELPFPMHHAMAAGVNGVLYVIGGEFQGAGTGLPEVFVNTVFAYDPKVGEWEARAPMPTGRSAGGAAVIDDKIYVAGGRPPAGNDFAVYDTTSDRWTALPDLPTPRNHLGIGAIGGKVYVAGGRFGRNFASERTAALEVYDPATNSWSARAPLPGPRGGVSSVVANGCLFIIGGEGEYADPRGLSVENEAYDARSDQWISLPPMPTPTHGLVGAAFIDGRIHLPGGSITLGGGSGSVIHRTYRPEISCM
jgi:N-acetylneuraminic acid mutarotase